MFVQIVAFINRSSHLLAAKVYGCQGQCVEGWLRRPAPQYVRHFQAPVAEGNDDVGELQSFTLVDRQNADAVHGVALYRLAADGLVPLTDEGIDVGGIVLHKLVQPVVESTEVGTLLVEALQLEDAVEALYQFVERHAQQFRHVSDVCFRQKTVNVPVFDEQVAFSHSVSEHRVVVEFDDGGLGQQVVGVRQQVKSLYQQTQRNGGIQAERLVADDAHIGHALVEVVGNERNVFIGAHQDGYVAQRGALRSELSDGVQQCLHGLLLVVVVRQEPDLDIAAPGTLLRHRLLHVVVGMAQLFCTLRIFGALLFVGLPCSLQEEGVVEVDNVTGRAVVDL